MTPHIYTNKRIIVGLTFEDQNNQHIGNVQYHGLILAADPDSGILIKRLDGGGTFNLPPAMDRIEKAELDEYRFHSTNEIVRSPDYILTMTIVVPKRIGDDMKSGKRRIEPEMIESFTTDDPRTSSVENSAKRPGFWSRLFGNRR